MKMNLNNESIPCFEYFEVYPEKPDIPQTINKVSLYIKKQRDFDILAKTKRKKEKSVEYKQ